MEYVFQVFYSDPPKSVGICCNIFSFTFSGVYPLIHFGSLGQSLLWCQPTPNSVKTLWTCNTPTPTFQLLGCNRHTPTCPASKIISLAFLLSFIWLIWPGVCQFSLSFQKTTPRSFGFHLIHFCSVLFLSTSFRFGCLHFISKNMSCIIRLLMWFPADF